LAATLKQSGLVAGPANRAEINMFIVLLVLIALLTFGILTFAPTASMLIELFPSRIRYTALSVPYHLGVAWFGGLAALARLRSSYTVEAEEVERTPAISESMETPSLFVLAFAACLLSVLIASRSCIGNRFEGLSAPALDFTDQATSRNLGNVVTLKSASARCGSCKNVSSPTLRNRSSDGLRVVERRRSVWPPT